MAPHDARALMGRIDERLAALGMNPREASINAGLTADAIRNISRAAREGKPYNPRSDTLQALAKGLETTVAWLTREDAASAASTSVVQEAAPSVLREGYRPPPEFLGARDFKVFASAECGPGELQVFSTEPYDLYPRPWNVARDPSAFGVLLTGDSMEPLYEAGQFVIVSPKAPLVKGKQALFLAEPMGGDFRASVKRYRGQTVDRWLVKQLNPEKEFAFERKEWGTAYRVLGALDG